MRPLECFAIILVLITMFTAAAYFHLKQTLHVERSYFKLGDPKRTPIISLRPAHVDDPPEAVIVHGLMASKESMLPMAMSLALSGIRCFILDLPGHGESKHRFEDDPNDLRYPRTTAAASAAINQLVKDGQLHPERAALVGHSMGSFVVLSLASERPFAAAVAISPLPSEAQGQKLRNLLVLVAEHDFKLIKAAARSLIAEATANGHQREGDLFGDFKLGSARKLAFITRATHSTIIFDPRVYDDVAAWIWRSLGRDRKPEPTGKLLLSTLAEFLVLVLLFFPWSWLICSAYSWSLKRSASPPDYIPGLNVKTYFVFFPALSVISVLLLRHVVPLSFVRLFGSDYLASLFFYLGVASLLALRFKRDVELPGARAFLLSMCFGLALFVFVYLSLANFLNRQALHLWLDWQRGLRAAALFPAVLPFFLADEAFCRSIQARSAAKAKGYLASIAASLTNKAAILGIVFLGAIFLKGAPWIVALISPALLLVFLLLQVYSAYIFSQTRNTIVSGTFNAASVAWIFSAPFVMI